MPGTGRSFFNRSIPRVEGAIPQIKFELIGQWQQATDLLRKLGPEVKESAIKAQLKMGNAIAVKVKAHLRNQDLKWQPLNVKYEEAKARKGLSTKMLLSYKTYYDNINVWQSGNRYLVNIGVKRGIYTRELNGKKSKLDVSTIAAIHEFSSGNRVPKRPLWNPTIIEMGGAKGLKKIFVESLVWQLRSRGIPVSQSLFERTSIKIDGSKIRF